jgi:Fe-S cluster biogenesis protein NfuA
VVAVEKVASKRSEAPKVDGVDVSSGVGAQVVKALTEFVAALVEADGGELYLVAATSDDVHLHLTGTCAGCPGATMTRDRLLEPAVHAAAPKATLRVTTGWRVPDGARRVQ